MAKNRGRSGPSTRLLRVGENVRHALSTILARNEVQDEDLKGKSITVSEVRVSSDLRNATVFVMPLGGDPDLKVTKALNKNSAYIRGMMGHVVQMKFTPQLKFKLDESFDEASNIERLLKDPRVAADLAASDTDESQEN